MNKQDKDRLRNIPDDEKVTPVDSFPDYISHVEQGLAEKPDPVVTDDSVPLTRAEIISNHSRTPLWSVVGDRFLERTFATGGMDANLKFLEMMSDVVEPEKHYSDILITDCVTIRIVLYTKSIKGLSHRDFEIATEIDAVWSRIGNG